ncbi:MAG TPA: MATE family efflux transporter [Lachnospiraceae bacterium]|nr:MATE family efflux transporter [Lachnospiraceae bacterium]
MRKYETDLTEGNVTKQLLSFATPFFLAQILQACYSMADMLIAGRFMGDYGISAIINSSVCIMLITMLVNGFALSGTVLVAQHVGAKQPENAKKTISTLFTVFIYCAVAITILGILFTNKIIVMLNTPQEAVTQARNYLRICFGGTIFICGYNAVSAVLRGLGDSKRPLYFVAVATGVNVVLDLIFVGVLGWGAGGAAFATILAQALSFGLAVRTLYKNNFLFDFKLKSFVIYKDKLKMILKIGLPSAIQSTVINFSMLFVLTAINGYGLAASTAAGIGAKIDSFAILPTIAVSQSVASMSGQNLGAGRIDRTKETVFAGVKISLSFGVIIYLFVNLCGIKIVDIFNCSPQTVEVALMYIKYVSVFYIANSVMFVINGLAAGSGNAIFALGNAVLSVIIVRIPLIYIFQNFMGLGLRGVFMAMGLAQYAGLVTAGLFYISGKWKKSLVK